MPTAEIMIRCPTCQTANLDTSRFCDECGSRLVVLQEQAQVPSPPSAPPAYVPPSTSGSFGRPANVTSIGVPPPVATEPEPPSTNSVSKSAGPGASHASLVIERGEMPGTEFRLTADESTIGRWDADNGIFPDVDLDAHDTDAKVSRRHARIVRRNGGYYIEDLGSTNGTYVNRGRRLLPGSAQALSDGDEVIVGKTFLRFRVVQ